MITQSYLKERLFYNPDTGVFVWLASAHTPQSWNTRWAGKIAGIINKTNSPRGTIYQSVKIRLCGKSYAASRLAWLYMTGAMPANEVDHKDRDSLNNIWSNLREATHSQNKINTSPRRDNKSGVTGVCFRKDISKWRAYAAKEGKVIRIGTYQTLEEAVRARRDFAKIHYGEFSA